LSRNGKFLKARRPAGFFVAKIFLDRLKKYYSHSKRGFLSFGEASAKAQV